MVVCIPFDDEYGASRSIENTCFVLANGQTLYVKSGEVELYDGDGEDKIHYERNKYFHQGYFTWVDQDIGCSMKLMKLNIKRSDLMKIIYLSTYLHFNDTKIWLNYLCGMRESDLPKVLRLSPDASKEFLLNMMDCGLIDKEDEDLYINKGYFCKGHIKKRLKNSLDKTHLKFYNDGIREIYKTLDKNDREMSKFAKIFLLIPYLNIRFNIVCKNPLEQDIRKIIPMSVGECCKLIDCDVKNPKRFISGFGSFVIQDQPLIFNRLNIEGNPYKDLWAVNPNFFYMGNEDHADLISCFNGTFDYYGENDNEEE